MEMLKKANFTDIVTQEFEEVEKQEFEYNTPLPFDPNSISGRFELCWDCFFLFHFLVMNMGVNIDQS